MDQDQLIKQVEWLDKERREDKKAIAALQKKVAELEGLLEKSNSAIKDSNSEITRLNVVVAKVDKFEDVITEHRAGVKKLMDDQEKRTKEREKSLKKSVTGDVDQFRTEIGKLAHDLEKFTKMHQQLADNQEDLARRDRSIAELSQEISELKIGIETNKDSFKMIQGEREGTQKRITDLVGEISAVRTKLDELRGWQDVFTEINRKTEARISELIASEENRRTTQLEYLENITRENETREKAWKHWEKRFAEIEQRAEEMHRSLATYSDAEKAVKKAQTDLEAITEQITRRIHEITEMQRLGEERFRQEWNTFKADDQKRWANYALTQDEQIKETSRRFERLSERATDLEELTQDMRDTVQHTSEQFEKLMQGVLASLRDWLATTERYSDRVG